MLTDQDIKNLIEANKRVFPTKEEFKNLTVAVADLKVDMETVKSDLGELKETVQALTVAIDGLTKAINDLRAEYSAIVSRIERHEKWIKEIADKVGVKLE